MKKVLLHTSSLGGLALFIFLALGSASTNFVPVEQGKIATQGIVITAEDGSFELKSGENFTPPFYTEGKSGAVSTDDYLESEGQRVRVNVPGLAQPLYGILEFSEVVKDCKGKSPATRLYYIQIPQEYIQQAMGGKISVVYEYYQCSSGNMLTTVSGKYRTWVLWLSDSPIL